MKRVTIAGITGFIIGMLVSTIGVTKYTERDMERREREYLRVIQGVTDAKQPNFPVTRAGWECVALARKHVPRYKGLRDSEVLLRITREGLEAMAWRDSVEHASHYDGRRGS